MLLQARGGRRSDAPGREEESLAARGRAAQSNVGRVRGAPWPSRLHSARNNRRRRGRTAWPTPPAGATSAQVRVPRRAGLPIRERAPGQRCSPRSRRTLLRFAVDRLPVRLDDQVRTSLRARGDRHAAAEWTTCVECEERATRAGHPGVERTFGHQRDCSGAGAPATPGRSVRGRGKRPLLGRDFRAVAAVVVVVVDAAVVRAVLLRRRVESARFGHVAAPRYVPPSHLWGQVNKTRGIAACARWYLHARHV